MSHVDAGYRYAPIPTRYRGIMMRSKLETRFAHFCDLMGWGWDYEPKKFYCSKNVTYIPDFFVLVGSSKSPLWIELKPTLKKAKETRSRMEIIHCRHPEAVNLAVVIPTEEHPVYSFLSKASDPSRIPAFFTEAQYYPMPYNDEGFWFGSEDGHDGRFLDCKHWHIDWDVAIDHYRRWDGRYV